MGERINMFTDDSFNGKGFSAESSKKWDMPKEMWTNHFDYIPQGERGSVKIDSATIVRDKNSYTIVVKANQQMGIKNVYHKNWDYTKGPYPYTAKGWFNGYMKWKQVPMRGKEWDKEVQEKLGSFVGKRAESHAYSYAYNEGHSDSRKKKEYRPNLATPRQEGDFKRILKQKGAEDRKSGLDINHCVSCDKKLTYKNDPTWIMKRVNGKYGRVCNSCLSRKSAESFSADEITCLRRHCGGKLKPYSFCKECDATPMENCSCEVTHPKYEMKWICNSCSKQYGAESHDFSQKSAESFNAEYPKGEKGYVIYSLGYNEGEQGKGRKTPESFVSMIAKFNDIENSYMLSDDEKSYAIYTLGYFDGDSDNLNKRTPQAFELMLSKMGKSYGNSRLPSIPKTARLSAESFSAEKEGLYFVFEDGKTMMGLEDNYNAVYLEWKIPYSQIRNYVNEYTDDLWSEEDQEWRLGDGPYDIAYDFAHGKSAPDIFTEPFGEEYSSSNPSIHMDWEKEIEDAVKSRIWMLSDNYNDVVDLDDKMTKAEIRSFLTGIPSWQLTKRAESFSATKGIDTFTEPLEEMGVPKWLIGIGGVVAAITGINYLSKKL